MSNYLLSLGVFIALGWLLSLVLELVSFSAAAGDG
jgi:hypothetical protein